MQVFTSLMMFSSQSFFFTKTKITDRHEFKDEIKKAWLTNNNQPNSYEVK